VADFSNVGRGSGVAWTSFDGKMVGSAFGRVLEDGRQRVYVGTAAGGVYRAGDDGVWEDAGVYFRKYVKTKAYDVGIPGFRKDFLRFALEFDTEAPSMAVDVYYLLNAQSGRRKKFSISYTVPAVGGIWGVSLWGSAVWGGTEGSASIDFTGSFAGSIGRRAETVQFLFDSNSSQSPPPQWTLKRLSIDFVPLTRKWTSDANLDSAAVV
jgi:hypothetical protein